MTLSFVLSRSLALLVCVALAVAPNHSTAQDPAAADDNLVEHAQLDAQLEEIRRKYQLPAMWCGVFHLDGRKAIATTGVRRWNSEPEAQLTDPIHLGSCTKAMTATLIAQLCSEGKLRFDMTLHEIFPEDIPSDSSWRDVTVQQLLRHESGLPANLDWWKLMKGTQDAVEARRMMFQSLKQRHRPKKPAFLYSNTGYALLGHIVEKIDGRPWEESLRVRVAQPLHINTIGFGPVLSPQAKSPDDNATTNTLHVDVPYGHTWSPSLSNLIAGALGGKPKTNWQPQQIDNPASMGPAGSVHTTLSDWAKFTLVFADTKGNERLNISADVWKKLLESEGKDRYAGGWIVSERSWAGGRIYTHAGSNTTWYCVAFVAPEQNRCVLAATNAYSDATITACDEALGQAIKIELK